MALENGGNVDFASLISSIPGISMIIELSKIALIVIIAYLIFLIIRSVVQIKSSYRIKKIAQNVEEINKKMDVFIKNTKKK